MRGIVRKTTGASARGSLASQPETPRETSMKYKVRGTLVGLKSDPLSLLRAHKKPSKKKVPSKDGLAFPLLDDTDTQFVVTHVLGPFRMYGAQECLEHGPYRVHGVVPALAEVYVLSRKDSQMCSRAFLQKLAAISAPILSDAEISRRRREDDQWTVFKAAQTAYARDDRARCRWVTGVTTEHRETPGVTTPGSLLMREPLRSEQRHVEHTDAWRRPPEREVERAGLARLYRRFSPPHHELVDEVDDEPEAVAAPEESKSARRKKFRAAARAEGARSSKEPPPVSKANRALASLTAALSVAVS